MSEGDPDPDLATTGSRPGVTWGVGDRPGGGGSRPPEHPACLTEGRATGVGGEAGTLQPSSRAPRTAPHSRTFSSLRLRPVRTPTRSSSFALPQPSPARSGSPLWGASRLHSTAPRGPELPRLPAVPCELGLPREPVLTFLPETLVQALGPPAALPPALPAPGPGPGAQSLDFARWRGSGLQAVCALGWTQSSLGGRPSRLLSRDPVS